MLLGSPDSWVPSQLLCLTLALRSRYSSAGMEQHCGGVPGRGVLGRGVLGMEVWPGPLPHPWARNPPASTLGCPGDSVGVPRLLGGRGGRLPLSHLHPQSCGTPRRWRPRLPLPRPPLQPQRQRDGDSPGAGGALPQPWYWGALGGWLGSSGRPGGLGTRGGGGLGDTWGTGGDPETFRGPTGGCGTHGGAERPREGAWDP